VIADDAALVLHHEERGREVRWGPRKARRGAASSSTTRQTAAASQDKSGREVRALAFEANGLILGRMGEVAVCLSMGEKAGRKGPGLDPAEGSPRGAVQPWGLALTVGRRAYRGPAVARAGCVVCSSRGGGALGRWCTGPDWQRER
jgi:hypothetical protein